MKQHSNWVSTGVLSIFLVCAAFAAAVVATILDIKVFGPWGQVSDLWESTASPLEMIGHPHMPRYIVVYPGFLLEERLPGIGFSIYIACFFAINMMLLGIISRKVSGHSPTLLIYSLFIAAHLMMNGRGAIAWSGWLICICVCIKIADYGERPGAQVILITISSVLSAVSTGVFVVVLLAFGFIIARHWRSKRKQNPLSKLAALAAGLPIAYVSVEYFFVAVDKNVGFFGGGLDGAVAMLDHGLGVYISELNMVTVWLIGVLAVFGLILARLALSRRWQLSTLDYLIVFAALGGLFGFTVLTLMIPPVVLRAFSRERVMQAHSFSFPKL